jgi:hypothetical protein
MPLLVIYSIFRHGQMCHDSVGIVYLVYHEITTTKCVDSAQKKGRILRRAKITIGHPPFLWIIISSELNVHG